MFDFLMAGVAFAQESGGGEGGGGLLGGMGTMLPLILMFVIFYFLLIRPQQKKQKAHREMVASLQKGTRILTAGGIYGKITGLDDATLTVEIAPQVRVKVARTSVSGLADAAPPPAQDAKK